MQTAGVVSPGAASAAPKERKDSNNATLGRLLEELCKPGMTPVSGYGTPRDQPAVFCALCPVLC